MPYVKHSDSADGGGGAASDIDDFIRNKLATFITSSTLFPASGDRWTRSKSDVNFASKEYDVFLTPPTNLTTGQNKPAFMAFHTKGTSTSGLAMFPASGFDTNRPAYDQPGGPGCGPDVANLGGGNFGPDYVTQGFANTGNGGGSTPSFMPQMNLLPTGPFLGHHLFAPADGSYCYAAINIGTRRWRHMLFGSFSKFGGPTAFVGGEFVFGHHHPTGTSDTDLPYSTSRFNLAPFSANNSSVNVPGRCGLFKASGIQSSPVSDWFTTCAKGPNTAGPNTITAGTRASGGGTPGYSNVNQTSGVKTTGIGMCNGLGAPLGTMLFSLNASLLANVRPLLPLYFSIFTSLDGGMRTAPIGQAPDVFRINMKGLSPGQLIAIGSFNYAVFPVVNNDIVNTVANDEYSGYEGFAYRVRP